MSFLGDKIRELRKQNGISQEDVATALGVSRQAVTKWESGVSLPSSGNMIKLAELFKVSVDELTSSSRQSPVNIDSEAIEKFIRSTEDKKKKEQKILSGTIDILKNMGGLLIAYGAIYLFCWFLNVQIGVSLFPWHYIQEYHFLLATCVISLLAVILQKKKFAYIMLAGAILAIFMGQIIGSYSTNNSPLAFNKSWIGLVLLWNISLIVGVIVELIARKRTSGYYIGRKPLTRILAAALSLGILLSITGTVFKSYQKLMFSHGAEQGYCLGFTQGEYDAKKNLPKEAAVVNADIPSEYALGTSKYNGFAQYWSYGYEEGYASIKGR